MHRFDTKQLVVNMKVEILTVNEFCSRFLVKRNQFYLEARLTCPLYRPTEDICIGIYVSKRVFNVWHMLKKSVSMQQHFEQFVGKQRRVELKPVGQLVAKTVLVEIAKQFLSEELCRTQNSLKYFFEAILSIRPSEKNLNEVYLHIIFKNAICFKEVFFFNLSKSFNETYTKQFSIKQ